MEWQNPETLYLILPLCVGWLTLALYSERRRQAAREAFAASAMWSRIFPVESRSRFFSKLILREIAIAMSLVALAGPKFGVEYEQVIPRGSDLYVLIDVSRSMLADDVLPSRLGRAKADIASLVNRLEGERIGLIAFAGQAVVKCPLTIDYDSFRRSLEELDPDSAPRGGTAIGDAIRKALEVFQAKSERDQAILLITDGDDQQSYPLEAAEAAAERHVTIFTVGLGDAVRGARIPQKSDAQGFLEYQGEQVWSKLDGNLLQQIALKTSGVYVPAGTRSYDLSELYANYLQGRRSSEATSEKKIRRSERYQLFLAIAVVCLLIDLCVARQQRPKKSADSDFDDDEEVTTDRRQTRYSAKTAIARSFMVLMFTLTVGPVWSNEPHAAIRAGLRLYSQDKFDDAKDQFASAAEEFEKRKLPAAAALAAFDEACALHRKGEFEKARECYLRAGLSQDQSTATAAHFNLGNLSADKARQLCGDHPESVPAEKRNEILEQLSQATTSYRHCLELKSDHVAARRNLELIRQWIKYYSDKWREQDRQKRREESNLLQFLEFMIQTQAALRDMTRQASEQATADDFAEIRRAQEELREEIPALRDKIAETLHPDQQPNAAADPGETQETEEAIALLRDWADQAGRKMSSASSRLKARDKEAAANDQQAAQDELEKIWDAVVPFHPLLKKLLDEQTSISNQLKPETRESETPSEAEPSESKDEQADPKPQPAKSPPADQNTPAQISNDQDFQQAQAQQSKALKRAQMLGPKAKNELERLENNPSQPNENTPGEKGQDQSSASVVDPEQMKRGLKKAIELSPQAVEQMESTVEDLRRKDAPKASIHAEQARKILEEIQKVQPKNDQQQKQQNQDQRQDQQQDQNKQDQKKDDDSQKQQDPQRDQQAGKDQQPQEQKPQGQLSQDQIEEALRKVRERQQEKRERDRKMRAVRLGKTSVEKDW